jgi:hypothetical protein
MRNRAMLILFYAASLSVLASSLGFWVAFVDKNWWGALGFWVLCVVCIVATGILAKITGVRK